MDEPTRVVVQAAETPLSKTPVSKVSQDLPRFIATDGTPTPKVDAAPPALGSHLSTDGADFAVFAPHATRVQVALIDPDPSNPSEYTERRFVLRPLFGLWTGHIPGVHAGQRYGYRVDGPWDPSKGLFYNPAKLLIDPYARGLEGRMQLNASLYAHTVDNDLRPLTPWQQSDLDSAPFVPYSVVLPEPNYSAQHPHTPWDRTVIYEAHVKGFTAHMPGIPPELRGTYAGLAHPAAIRYLHELGITAIELLPIHAKMTEPAITQRGLVNYWGYNTLNFFTPEPTYATQAARDQGPEAVNAEVKSMIHSLHDAGIEVILDVVYNHTAEGRIEGPTLSWRGLDHQAYYVTAPGNPAQLIDSTGTGNSLDFRQRAVLQLALDSLRYWVREYGVDGFRFDLAVTLARRGDQFDSSHPFYMALATDELLSQVKLINEPWDLGPGGWRTGQFPAPTADWNDRFRDTVRDFWVAGPRNQASGGRGSDLRDLATRLAGSADLFSSSSLPDERGTYSSINFVTVHDGFTLRDLVSYNDKHNEANGEANHDGTNNNHSWNHGVEGETAETTAPGSPIAAARARAQRNLLGTLLLAAGTPMILAGDEISRTQHGNNNAYNQDNALTWIDWNLSEDQQNLHDTVAYLIHLRRAHRVLRPKHFFKDVKIDGDELEDVTWLSSQAEEMNHASWFDSRIQVVQMLRSGEGRDVDALLIFNGSPARSHIRLPRARNHPFVRMWDSSWERPHNALDTYAPGAATTIEPLSMQLYFGQQRETPIDRFV
ncbi:MAG: glycogen debranching protein GlgX [Actinomycetaceae bacterium]|nr:glycogen debranching protein GlgX [Actinomycetaceae bacterium]MDY6083408.1 glycogen debranching protein GlgX [Actinomycetaceae bacterium]